VKGVAEADFVERVALTLAKIDESDFEKDPERYRLLARAAMTELRKPTPDMISAAYEAVRFDESWAINSGRDFKKGVKAMIYAALESPNKRSE
jgi:hypothetical protein